MNDKKNILITLTNGSYLIKVAVRLDLDEDIMRYPLERENKEMIKRFLPRYVRDFGAIVDVEEIFDVKDLTIKTNA
jgi:hypothetical protein